MQINDLKEYNCLMRHGVKEGLNAWFWTDGNDVDKTGAWTHAYDGSEVSFFAKDINCCEGGDGSCHHGGDAFLLCLACSMKKRGNYCDEPSNEAWNFICEAVI